MRILLGYPTQERHWRQVEQTWQAAGGGELELIAAEQEELAEELPKADIFCGHAKVPVSWPAVVQSGRMQWIQSSAAGLDHCLTPEVVASEIVVTSASGLFADQVAEQTLALLLGLLRSLPVFFRAAQKREFIRRPTGDLHGKTVGIVGFGGNGRRLAEVLAPWRVRMLATDKFPIEKPDWVEQLWPAERLEDVLAEADIVILTVPLTDETRRMIDARRLASMKPGSLLVNVARGQVVVEEALVAALESGHLAGAGLDVTEIEPLPPESQLWERPDVIITPHVGAQSARRYDTVTTFFCENLRRYLQGEPLLNRVDKRLGYPERSRPAGSLGV